MPAIRGRFSPLSSVLLLSGTAVLLYFAGSAMAAPEHTMNSAVEQAKVGLLEMVGGKRNSPKFLFAFNRVWDAGWDAVAHFSILMENFALEQNFHLVMKPPEVGSRFFAFILQGTMRTVTGLSPLKVGIAPGFIDSHGTAYGFRAPAA